MQELGQRFGPDPFRLAEPMVEVHPPWFLRAVELLELRSRNRLLLAMPGSVDLAVAAANLCGTEGSVTILEPRRAVARALVSALPAAEVVVTDAIDAERFGSFDSVLGIPLCGPLPPVEAWAGLVAKNLRPGGRFAIDLPAPTSWPDVTAAAKATSPDFAARLAEALSGPTIDELMAALEGTGLRQVQSLLGTHLTCFASPFDLIDLLSAWHRIDPDDRSALGDALSRQLRRTTDIETLAHRSAVSGMR